MHEIRVIFDPDQKVKKVEPNSCKIPFELGVNQTITWIPESNVKLKIVFLGFESPVGKGCPIGIPRPVTGSGNWQTTNLNNNQSGNPIVFPYQVFAEVDGVVFQIDPEIENEAEGGM